MAKAKALKAAAPNPSPTPTKTELVLGLLREGDGATLDGIVAATAWQPHTARALLSGFRKKGFGIERLSGEGTTRYRLVSEPQK